MEYCDIARRFVEDMPYKLGLYGSRNWGHSWHSLCSYHGKLKPSIAHFLVKYFTEPGDTILDPLCGVGTIPFEAALQGRKAIGNDLSTMAYIISTAKLKKPEMNNVINELALLEKHIQVSIKNIDTTEAEGFGLNGKISEYYHEQTLREIVCAREYFLRYEDQTPERAMLISCLLHILHGNRPYALSRRSHPLTPYAPTGDYEYRSLIEHTRSKILLSYRSSDWADYMNGDTYNVDYKQLPVFVGENVDAIITSPPFVNSLRFYTSNWLRLWFVGWNREDFQNADRQFLEGQQKKDLDIYKYFFTICKDVLKSNGKLILHLGKSKKVDMAEELIARIPAELTYVYHGSEKVEMLEKHGIRDKGTTIEHQFLFLIRR